jgi:hypothetical protein
MIVTTFVTVCQSAPVRRRTKLKDEHRRHARNDDSQHYNNSNPYHSNDGANSVNDHSNENWPPSSSSNLINGNWTQSTDKIMQPGSSSSITNNLNLGENEESPRIRHQLRHRQQHDERNHDSKNVHSSRRKHHKHKNQLNQQTEERAQSDGNANNRGQYEHLCETVMKTVHLNTNNEEYNPPFYVEVRCKQPEQSHSYSTVQVRQLCVLYPCIQNDPVPFSGS